MSATAAKSCGSPAVYHRRQPERTVLYRVVQAHLATCLALHDDGWCGHAPTLAESEFRRHLECGILAHGFSFDTSVRIEANDRQGLEPPPEYEFDQHIAW